MDNKNTKNVNNKNIIIFFLVILMLGSILGSIIYNYTNIINVFLISEVSDAIFLFFQEQKSQSFSFSHFLLDFFKSAKYFIFIWFLGFIPSNFTLNKINNKINIKYFFIYLIIFIKGFFIGFTSSIIIGLYDFTSLFYILKNYMLTTIIFIITNIYMCYISINFTKSTNIFFYIKSLLAIFIINFIIILILNILKLY